MIRRIVLGMAASSILMLVGSSGQAAQAHPEATPLRTVIGWFRAINAKEARKAKSYLAPSALAAWANWPTSTWSTFTHLHCKTLRGTRREASVTVKCTFHESDSRSEGNPDTWWAVDLHRSRHRWLIVSWGQP